MSLVILVILTLIGVAAMSTASLEERMAGNIQDGTHAFEAAESGLNRALNTPGLLSPTTNTSADFDFTHASARVTTNFMQFSQPRRGSGFAVDKYDAANFNQRAEGETTTGARSFVNRGTAQVTPKAD